ncbi:acetyltransferase [Bacillus coahuilensis m2-6]|uniref:GNAT family N-acetyltransferase n=2 Tax=Bacillus coahuilensis TaxID=408580 RepID=UPI0007505A3D|nr:GNAT family N-acetyltransferase [Bacillus coahuilensis]KUP09609.1 acetyltransferase [Bacillus coahuilensis m2-6]
MKLTFKRIQMNELEQCRGLCNELMNFQKSKAYITPERFDTMNFDTRMIPSVANATHNFVVIVKDGSEPVGYVYANISPKKVYSSSFATFFDLTSVEGSEVGCLSQFYIKEEYRMFGIGSMLYSMCIQWLSEFEVQDYFVFVSNGNEEALEFYKHKGFYESHDILNRFITVLRTDKQGIQQMVQSLKGMKGWKEVD